MAVLQAIGTKGTGKLGSVVYSVNHGVQVAREYQPTVSNPSTSAQVQQRAKLKLMSQLSAALSSVIAYQRDGLVSPRNMFTKANIGQAYTTENALDETTASVVYENLQLAQGSFAISGIHIARVENQSVTVSLISALAPEADRVAYILARKTDEGLISVIDTAVEAVAGDSRLFPHTFDYAAGTLVVWAYGLATTGANAKGKYYAYSVSNATDVATLVANRNLIENGVRLSYTRGKTLPYNSDESIDVPAGYVGVYMNVSGNGSITLPDGSPVSFPQVLPINSNFSYVAVADEGSSFVGWRENVTGAILSTNPVLSEVADDTWDMTAVFYTGNVVSLTVTSEGGGTVSVNGGQASSSVTVTLPEGGTATLQAIPDSGKDFAEWEDGNTDNPRTFVVYEDTSISASFL